VRTAVCARPDLPARWRRNLRSERGERRWMRGSGGCVGPTLSVGIEGILTGIRLERRRRGGDGGFWLCVGYKSIGKDQGNDQVVNRHTGMNGRVVPEFRTIYRILRLNTEPNISTGQPSPPPAPDTSSSIPAHPTSTPDSPPPAPPTSPNSPRTVP